MEKTREEKRRRQRRDKFGEKEDFRKKLEDSAVFDNASSGPICSALAVHFASILHWCTIAVYPTCLVRLFSMLRILSISERFVSLYEFSTTTYLLNLSSCYTLLSHFRPNKHSSPQKGWDCPTRLQTWYPQLTSTHDARGAYWFLCCSSDTCWAWIAADMMEILLIK